jgi:putative flavoprotein involved in K+ transport
MNPVTNNPKTHWNTIIIGGGQAGLAAAYYLKKRGTDFIILESENIGNSWRKRWDSLCLFTPSEYDGLPGMPFPSPSGTFPSKDRVAGYLEEYARYFSLPVLSNTKVHRLTSASAGFELSNSNKKFTSDHVIIASGTNPVPKIPAFSAEIDPGIYQIHSSAYTSPGSLPPGDALVVGAGTSGVEIAIELSHSRKAMIAGTPTFHIPDHVFKYAGGLYWWFVKNVLTVKTPMGRKAKPQILKGGAPLIRVSVKDLHDAGVKIMPRVTGIKNGLPVLQDGTTVHPTVIIWCTGYKPDFSWVQPVITDETGWPVTDRGVSAVLPNLYFVGMPFQYALTSGLIGGVGRDADYVVNKIN